MADPPVESDLSGILQQVLELQDEYSKDNTPSMHTRGLLVRQAGANRLRELLPESVDLEPADLESEGRDGTGLKTRVPWMRVFSASRSPSATRGWYVVYLFAFDGSAVFLSLNQGTTSPSGKAFKERSAEFLRDRVAWAKDILDGIEDLPTDQPSLLDPGGLGSGYEKGNVVARRYTKDAIPDEGELRSDLAFFVDMLARLYRAEEDPTLSNGLPTYDEEVQKPTVGDVPDLADVPRFIELMRARYGPELVSSRLDAEQEARDLLNAYAGAMSKEQTFELGRLFNRGVYAGALRSNRFSPAFAGASMERLADPLDEFNAWTARIWKENEDRALSAIDEILKTPSSFRGAGRSFTTMLMYLRDPEKFAIWLRITHDGLSALTPFSEPSDRRGGVERYLKFCDTARRFATEYSVQPQELDAIFAEAARVAAERKPLTPSPVKSDETSAEPVTLLQVAKATYLPVEQLEEWAELVTGAKKQALFYGPPGTGKTYIAEQLATYIASPSGVIKRAQFHPSYSYEDFIEGLRPEISSEEDMIFRVRHGSFRTFCDSVRDRDGLHVFVIDEINRAEIGSVLGELMMLLEYRNKEITLPYSQERFSVPSNVVVLATMNTADRSLALVDFALRRRFHAFELLPNRDVLSKWVAGRGAGGEIALRFFDLIQDAVASSDSAPGHSYWMVRELSAQQLLRVWKYELYPYLAEYWFEHRSRLDQLDNEVRELLAEEA